jgi:hypothetical protein
VDSRTHLVRLELWLDGDSPNGHAVGRGDEARQFAGWLGLIAAVEALIGDDRESDVDPAGDAATSDDTSGRTS